MAYELVDIPRHARTPTFALAFDIIKYASSFGPERWGLTYHDWGIRINVGWTEIFTASRDEIRLIVDRALASKSGLHIKLERRTDPRGYYPSVPGSALVRLPYTSKSFQTRTVRLLTPALHHAISLAARWRVGRGVRAGHNQWAVAQIAAALGRSVPSPGYVPPRARPPGQEAALSLMEGALKRVAGSRYERSPALRRACISHYGTSCFVCGFSFQRVFGQIGNGFIHVHHLTPISTAGVAKVHAIRDLRPVCPNCHAMLHREDPPLVIEQLRAMVREHSITSRAGAKKPGSPERSKRRLGGRTPDSK